jgi:hypothetical protein
MHYKTRRGRPGSHRSEFPKICWLLRALSLGMAPPRSAHKNGRDSLFPCGLCKSICRGAQTEKGNNILVHISKLAASEG